MRRFWWVLLLVGHVLQPAFAAANADRHALTPEVLRKIQAAEADLHKQGLRSADADDDDDADDETVEAMARRVDRDPRLKAALARQGLSGMDFAMSVHALLHASAYLMFEKNMDKQKAAALLASYTPQQRANIELVRKQAGQPR